MAKADKALTFRRYKDGDTAHLAWDANLIRSGLSDKRPTYGHKTPPCQDGCNRNDVAIVVNGIGRYLDDAELGARPKVDSRHVDLLDERQDHQLAPARHDHLTVHGTDSAAFAVDNYEDRSFIKIIPHDKLFLGPFRLPPHEPPSTKRGLHEFRQRPNNDRALY